MGVISCGLWAVWLAFLLMTAVARDNNLQVLGKSHLLLKSRSSILEREVFVLLLKC